MFFDDWQGILRVLVVGTLAYFALVAWLRVTGKRTVSKWNSFDLVVTVSLGSTLATVLLTKDVALVEGVIALGLLIMLQLVITWLSVRVGWVQQAIKAKPTLLLRDGEMCRDVMKEQRVAESELMAAVRSNGNASLEDIKAIVLETDGTFSVITKGWDGSRSAMENVPSVEVRGTGPGK